MGPGRSREEQARVAGEIIYNSLSLSGSTECRSRRHIPWENQACCGIMSPVRRTFCLLTVFDFIFILTLWVIYIQVLPSGDLSFWELLKEEIVKYTYKTSLFDTVLCGAWRAIPLLLFYGMIRIRNPYVVAVTTFGTCAFVLSKVFIFKFTNGKDNVICYLLLIASFIISWVEVWFLDFKVLPQEEKIREQEELGYYPTERTPLLAESGRAPPQESHEQFHSPKESYTPTPRGSDDEASGLCSPVTTRSRYQSTNTNKIAEYQEKAAEAWEKSWEILHTKDGWKKDGGHSLETGLVFSQQFKHIGKVFKLEVIVDCSPQALFEEMVYNCDNQSSWNATILEGRTLQKISDNIDIYYNIAAEAAGGLVSSRDFVTLRHWKTRDNIIMSAGCAVMHPDMPSNKKHVRGENRPGGWIFIPIPGEPTKCLFCWLINTDLKGWIPQYAIDQALSGTLLEFTRHVQKRMKELEYNR